MRDPSRMTEDTARRPHAASAASVAAAGGAADRVERGAELGRLALDVAFQPDYNVDLGFGTGFDPADVQVRTPFGATYPDDRAGRPRKFTLPFTSASEGDRVQLGRLQRLAGLAGDVFAFVDPAKTTDFQRYSIHGLFAAGGADQAIPWWDQSGQLWSLTMTINELI